MSGPRITDAAVEAGTEALAMDGDSDPSLLAEDEIELYFAAPVRKVLTAALPHIRRAVIEELVEKLTNTVPGPNWLGYKAWACDWLRAELEGDERG